MIQYIYKIENKLNGKVYIGKTKDLEKRIYQHRRNVGKKRHRLYDAILHYTWDNFLVEIIDKTEGDIDELEKHYIKQYNSITEGYNYTEGGEGGDTFTHKSEDEKNITRKKLSKAAKISNQKNIEKHRENTKKLWENPEYREKITKKLKEINQTEEYRTKISEGLKKRLKEPELLKKWSEVKSGKKNGRWLGVIVVYDENDNEIGRYETAVEAAKELGITAHVIRDKARNGEPYKSRKTKNYGIRFKFVK